MIKTYSIKLEDWFVEVINLNEGEGTITSRIKELLMKGHLYEMQEKNSQESKKPLIGGRLETSCSI